MKAEEYMAFWVQEATDFMIEKKVFNEFVERFNVNLLEENTKNEG